MPRCLPKTGTAADPAEGPFEDVGYQVGVIAAVAADELVGIGVAAFRATIDDADRLTSQDRGPARRGLIMGQHGCLLMPDLRHYGQLRSRAAYTAAVPLPCRASWSSFSSALDRRSSGPCRRTQYSPCRRPCPGSPSPAPGTAPTCRAGPEPRTWSWNCLSMLVLATCPSSPIGSCGHPQDRDEEARPNRNTPEHAPDGPAADRVMGGVDVVLPSVAHDHRLIESGWMIRSDASQRAYPSAAAHRLDVGAAGSPPGRRRCSARTPNTHRCTQARHPGPGELSNRARPCGPEGRQAVQELDGVPAGPHEVHADLVASQQPHLFDPGHPGLPIETLHTRYRASPHRPHPPRRPR